MRVSVIGGLIYVDIIRGQRTVRSFFQPFDPKAMDLDQLVIAFEARARAVGYPIDVVALRNQLMQALPVPDDDETAVLMGAFG